MMNCHQEETNRHIADHNPYGESCNDGKLPHLLEVKDKLQADIGHEEIKDQTAKISKYIRVPLKSDREEFYDHIHSDMNTALHTRTGSYIRQGDTGKDGRLGHPGPAGIKKIPCNNLSKSNREHKCEQYDNEAFLKSQNNTIYLHV